MYIYVVYTYIYTIYMYLKNKKNNKIQKRFLCGFSRTEFSWLYGDFCGAVLLHNF